MLGPRTRARTPCEDAGWRVAFWGWLAWQAGLWLAYVLFLAQLHLAVFWPTGWRIGLLAHWLRELPRSQRRSQPGAITPSNSFELLTSLDHVAGTSFSMLRSPCTYGDNYGYSCS